MPPRRHRRTLTFDEKNELTSGPELAVLMAFPRGEGRQSLFADEADRRAAWDANRESLMAACAQDVAGRRPWAYWAQELDRLDLTALDREPERVISRFSCDIAYSGSPAASRASAGSEKRRV